MTKNYLFQSDRLGFRNWRSEDIPLLAAINQDPMVMEFFPKTASEEETAKFVIRMQAMQEALGFCYFAVDQLSTGAFIGFIGLCEQKYLADFTPCIDIGWRLARTAWGQGFATEGAQRCLSYAFEDLALPKVLAIAPVLNVKSEQVMKKIAMQKVKEFLHPLLSEYKEIQNCVLYEIRNESMENQYSLGTKPLD